MNTIALKTTDEKSCLKSWLKDSVLLIALVSVLFGFMLGSRPLNVPDEGRYCEIPREMLTTHDFITPRINGIKYFEKPPMFYWMQASSLGTLGLNEWTGRLCDALMGLLGVWGIYFAGRKLFDRKTGLYSAAVLATSFLYFGMARVVTLDMTVSTWLVFSLLSFILGVKNHKFFYYFVYIFAAFAVLTKGLIGIIFPGGIIFLWLLITREWKILKECKPIFGSLIFLLIAAPWHILVQLKNPEFFYFYFIDQQFIRYLTLEAHRYQPDWFYIPIVLLGLFPWTGFLWGGLKQFLVEHKKNSPNSAKSALFFIVLSLGFIFIFYSFSKSKLVPYILPCFGLLSLIIGRYFAQLPNKFAKDKTLAAGFITSSLVSLSLAIAIPFCLRPDIAVDYAQAKLWASVVVIFAVINTFCIPIIYWKKGFFRTFIAQIMIITGLFFSLCAISPYIYMDSVKPFAKKILRLSKPQAQEVQDNVYTYDYYYQDLPFYLNKNIIIVDWKGEMEFGSHYDHDPRRMISNTEFWRNWDTHTSSSSKLFVVIPKDNFEAFQEKIKTTRHPEYTIIAKTKNDLLITEAYYAD